MVSALGQKRTLSDRSEYSPDALGRRTARKATQILVTKPKKVSYQLTCLSSSAIQSAESNGANVIGIRLACLRHLNDELSNELC